MLGGIAVELDTSQTGKEFYAGIHSLYHKWQTKLKERLGEEATQEKVKEVIEKTEETHRLLTDEEITRIVQGVKDGTLIINGLVCPDIELGIAQAQDAKTAKIIMRTKASVIMGLWQ